MLSYSVAETTATAYSTLIYTNYTFGNIPVQISPSQATSYGTSGPFLIKFRSV
jgi:hypothetical protein